MNGIILIALYTIVWLLLGRTFGLTWIEVFGLCIVGCLTGVLAFLFGVQTAQDPDIVVDHSNDAVHAAALAILRMEDLRSICPYCHGHLGRHSEKCFLKIARDSLVKLR